MVRVAIGPLPGSSEMLAAVRAAGGELVEPKYAEAIIWESGSGAGLRELLLAAPLAKWVQLSSAGVDWLFEEGVYSSRYVWTCAKGGEMGRNVAELAVLMLLSAAREFHTFVRAKAWLPEAGRPFAGSHIGVVGAGGIGRALVQRLRAFGVDITVVRRQPEPVAGANRVVTTSQFDGLVGTMDAVVLTLPLTPATHNFIDAKRLALFRSSAWLVNVGRGGLVDTAALVDVLERGGLGGASLDVVSPEPLPQNHPLWRFPNVVITPHVGNTWGMTGDAMTVLLTENFARWAGGDDLMGIVDERTGY